jgi:hypothetical protein
VRFFLFKGVVAELTAILASWVFLLEQIDCYPFYPPINAICGTFFEFITVVDTFLEVFELCFTRPDDETPLIYVLVSFFYSSYYFF